MIGRLLDKYEILAEVGQGGMSVVYRGRDRELLREVAIKVLHPHLASHAEAKVRFQREAQAVAKLRHDNILEIYDFAGAEQADSYIVTEFIHGRTLRDVVTDHALPYPELAAMIVSELAQAVAHAHKAGVLHRDIKPENVMVRDDGRLKLMDFGIAQIVDTQRMTVTGQLLGSPAYMSPEHVEGRPLDFRTDVFSLGIVLYQLATGVLPFPGKNPHEILKRIGECEPKPAEMVNPKVNRALARVIKRALARDPKDRHQEASSLAADLQVTLAEAELGDPREELARFFKTPAPYTQALRQRLVGAYTRRGRNALAAGKRDAALELWNRVLEIDPKDQAVAAELARLGARRRVRVLLTALVVGGAIAALVVARCGRVQVATPPTDPQARTPDDVAVTPPSDRPVAPTGPNGSAQLDPRPTPSNPRPTPGGPRPDGPTRPTPTPGVTPPGPGVTPPVVDGPRRAVMLTTQPKVAEVSIDGGAPQRVSGGRLALDLPAGAHELKVSNPLCFPTTIALPADDTRATIHASLAYLPRRLVVRCAKAQAITVDDRPVTDFVDIDLGKADSRKVTVAFLVAGQGLVQRDLDVRPGADPIEVACD